MEGKFLFVWVVLSNFVTNTKTNRIAKKNMLIYLRNILKYKIKGME